MKFRYMSDLHLEFGSLDQLVPQEEPTTLLLAGDIGVGKIKSSYLHFLEEVTNIFSHVVYIPGNHEFYRGNVDKTWTSMKKAVAEWLKDGEFDGYLHMLNKESVVIEDIEIFGTTLWTNYNWDPVNMMKAGMYMNDHKIIRRSSEYKKFTPQDAQAAHCEQLHWLLEGLKNSKYDKKIVVTHHGPSYGSVHERFARDPLNPAYVSDLTKDIMMLEDKAPQYWIHGHVHNSFDYMIGETNVLTNPRGYPGTYDRIRPENPAFDPNKEFEL